MSRTLIVSDIHIGDANANVAGFQQFLLSKTHARLIIAGDLWDLWLCRPEWLRTRYSRMLDVFYALNKTGVQLEYILGNHDEDYLNDPLVPLDILPVVPRSCVTVGGKRLAVIHGQTFDKYLKRHYMLYRLGFYVKAFRRFACPSWWRGRQDYRGRPKFAYLFFEMHARARETYAKFGYDGVIMGHTHLPSDTPEGAPFLFYNAGDWVEHNSYIEIEGENIALKYA